MEMSNSVSQKPSSPKEFFAKLYGHLEEGKDKLNENDNQKKDDFPTTKTTNDNFDILKKIKILDEVQKFDDLDRKLFMNSELVQRVPPPFPFLSTIVSSNVSAFSPDSTFSSGITNFLERRRRKEGRPRRQRTTFSSGQTLSLELEYHRSEYISRGRRFELAESLHLTETQIKIWFQNRRAKDKRIEKAQIDQQYRNLLLTSGLNGFGIPRNNFCGVCMYRSKLSPSRGNVSEFFNHNCTDRQPFTISENRSILEN